MICERCKNQVHVGIEVRVDESTAVRKALWCLSCAQSPIAAFVAVAE